jgi:twitching motility protein PilT
MIMDIHTLLQQTADLQASDLHLKAGSPPIVRIDGVLQSIPGLAPLSREDVQASFADLATPDQMRVFETQWELDFSCQLESVARFRVNVCLERGSVNLSFRRVPMTIPDLDALGLPTICRTLAVRRRGMILVTGPTGSGKSTSLAAMIDCLNHLHSRRVVTIEDPIEYVYRDHRCVITQRELGSDTHSFALAARQSLRQDPDVLLVGEMRDPETMAACLTAAETGHLVMSTLHTNSGPQTIDRIIDAFPPYQQNQIRMQLSLTLEAVLSQLLLPRQDGQGRVAAVEVMIATAAIRNLIREGKTHQMPSVLQTSAQAGMQTLDGSLHDLVTAGAISIETALEHAANPDGLRALLGRA